MSPLTALIIVLIVLFVLFFLGLPVGFCFIIAGLLGLFSLAGINAALTMSTVIPYSWATSISLMAIPLFVLMGTFCQYSGITHDLFSAGYKWLGRLPGGLCIATIFAATIFAATTGSSAASAATIGTVSWKELQARKYDPGLATATIAASGTMGIMIPPSVPLIFYALVVEESIGKLFMAGIFPGLLQAFTYVLLVVILVKRKPHLAPPSLLFSWKERFVSLKGVWGVLALITLVLGGIYGGVFTPTEGAGVGAFGAFVLMIARRKLTKQHLISSLVEGGKITSLVFLLIIGVMFFVSFISLSGITQQFIEWLGKLPYPPIIVLSFMLLIYIPLGCFMTTIPMMALTIPFIYPFILAHGFSPIWFGVILVWFGELAAITPPLGMEIYIIKGVTGIPLQTIFKGAIPFIIVDLINIALVVAVPQIALFLPGMMMK